MYNSITPLALKTYGDKRTGFRIKAADMMSIVELS